MAAVVEEVEIEKCPDLVWSLIADSARLPEWFAGVESCRVQGELRMCELRGGRVVTERIVTSDAQQRLFEYAVVDGLPLTSHLASIRVMETASGCRVVYRTECEPESALSGLRGSMSSALEALAGIYNQTIG